MSSTLKRLRRRKMDSEGEPEFQVAPMVDVLLVLLLFFMSITSTEILKKEKNLHLPTAKNAKKPKKDPNEIILNVTWDATDKVAGYSIDGTHYPNADALQPVLQARASGNPRAYVLIRADKSVTYSNIADAMTACSGAGIGTVTFGVITGGGDKKGASTEDVK